MREPQSLPVQGGGPLWKGRACADDGAESDGHEDCPFREILSIRPSSWRAMVHPSAGLNTEVVVRGQRLSDGRAKSVRFADSEWRYCLDDGDYLNGLYDVNSNECGPPKAPVTRTVTEQVSRGRFYRRHDGRFMTRSEPKLDTPGVYGPIPYSKTQPVSPQDILRNIRYQARCSGWENHENCPFREIMRIQPARDRGRDKMHKKAKSRSASPAARKQQHLQPDMKVRGMGAVAQGLKDLAVEETDPVALKWPSYKESPLKTWPGTKGRSGFLDDPPGAAPTSKTKALMKVTGPQEHGVGCRYRRIPCPLPWFVQCNVAEPGPLYFMVLPGLYVGNFRDSKDPEQLKAHHITHILSIHDNARKLPCNSDKEYLCIVASDTPGQNLTQYFPACNDFIHTARLKGGSVLIHCLAGMSRSVTVAVVYVMCVTSLSWRDALKAVQGARNVANPNVGFLKQLQDFESERMNDERRRIKAKYPSLKLEEEDEQMAKQLLASYYHSLSLGEMCEGNCPAGVTCPRGLCHPTRRVGLFRRNSASRSSSPSRRSCSPSRSPYSPSSSPVSPRRSSPTPPSPLTRRSSRSSSPQLTPPQQSSPQLTPQHASHRTVARRSSSPLTSPRHAGHPLSSPTHSQSSTSPHPSSSPASPQRSRSPARSYESSPANSLYGSSSSINSPKHTLHSYTSPPSSPSRSVSPLGSQKCKSSPVPSPKSLSSAPNSPQHTSNKVSPKSFFRQCTLWMQSTRKASDSQSSKNTAVQKEVVDHNRNPQPNKEFETAVTQKEQDVFSNGPATQVSPQRTRNVSPSNSAKAEVSLPQSHTDYSPYTQPEIMKSYVHIYRQSSLPEEETDEALQFNVSPFSSPQHQRHRWITRHRDPLPVVPCPYDELFRQASLQDSRHKPNKTQYQQTSISVPQLNKNIQAFPIYENSELHRKCTRLSSLNTPVCVSDSPEKLVHRQSSLPEGASLNRNLPSVTISSVLDSVRSNPFSVSQKLILSPESVHQQIHLVHSDQLATSKSEQDRTIFYKSDTTNPSIKIEGIGEYSLRGAVRSLENLREDKDSENRTSKESTLVKKESSHVSSKAKESKKPNTSAVQVKTSSTLVRVEEKVKSQDKKTNSQQEQHRRDRKSGSASSKEDRRSTPPLRDRKSSTSSLKECKSASPPLQEMKMSSSRERKCSTSSSKERKSSTSSSREKICSTSSSREKICSISSSKEKICSTSSSREKICSTSTGENVCSTSKERRSSSSSLRDRKSSGSSIREGKPGTPPLHIRKSSSSSLRESREDRIINTPPLSDSMDSSLSSQERKLRNKKPGTPPVKRRKSSNALQEDSKLGNVSVEKKKTDSLPRQSKKRMECNKTDSLPRLDKLPDFSPECKQTNSLPRHSKMSGPISKESKRKDSLPGQNKKPGVAAAECQKISTLPRQDKKIGTGSTESAKPKQDKKIEVSAGESKKTDSLPRQNKKSVLAECKKTNSLPRQDKKQEKLCNTVVHNKKPCISVSQEKLSDTHSTKKRVSEVCTTEDNRQNTSKVQPKLPDAKGSPSDNSKSAIVGVHENRANSPTKEAPLPVHSNKHLSNDSLPRHKTTSANQSKHIHKPSTNTRQSCQSNVVKTPDSSTKQGIRSSKSGTFKRQHSRPRPLRRQSSKTDSISSNDSETDSQSRQSSLCDMPVSDALECINSLQACSIENAGNVPQQGSPSHPSCAVTCLPARTLSKTSMEAVVQEKTPSMQNKKPKPKSTNQHQSPTTCVQKSVGQSQTASMATQHQRQAAALVQISASSPGISKDKEKILSSPIQEQPRPLKLLTNTPNSCALKVQARVFLIQSQPSCSPCLSSFSGGGSARAVTTTYPYTKAANRSSLHFSSVGDVLSPCTPKS